MKFLLGYTYFLYYCKGFLTLVNYVTVAARFPKSADNRPIGVFLRRFDINFGALYIKYKTI